MIFYADLEQPISDGVDQRLERGVDDVAGHPDRRPGVAVLSVTRITHICEAVC